MNLKVIDRKLGDMMKEEKIVNKHLDIPFKDFMPGQIIQSSQFNDDMLDIEDKVNEIVDKHNLNVNKLHEHLDDKENPHEVNPHQIGTYEGSEIDAFIDDVKNGNLNDEAITNRVLSDACIDNRVLTDGAVTLSKLDTSIGNQIDISNNMSIKERYTKLETDAIIQEKVGDGTYSKEQIDAKFEEYQAGTIVDGTLDVTKLKGDVGRKLDIEDNSSISNRYTKSEVNTLIAKNGLPKDWGNLSDEVDDEIVTQSGLGSLPISDVMVCGEFKATETDVLNIKVQDVEFAKGEFNTLEERLNEVDSQLVDKVNKNELVINVIDFGAKGDGVTDDTQAFQNAINASYTGKSLFVPPGQYLISRTLNIKNAGFTMYGGNSRDSKIIVSKNFNNGVEFSPIIKIAMDNKSDAIDKVNIRDLGFDGSRDTVNTRGIQFEFLIYSSSFRNLNFDYFTGACLYSSGTYNDRCEMITFEHIKMNPYHKALAEPQVKLTRVNESIFTNCRFFSKEHGANVTHNQPLLYMDTCQGIDIKSNAFFYSDNAPCIETYCNTGITQGVFIDSNTFERNNNDITINIKSTSGENGYATENVVIGNNRTNVTGYKVRFSNVRKSQVLDPFANIVLDNIVDGCYFLTNSNYGVTVVDNTSNSNSRNSVVNIAGTYDDSMLRVTNRRLKSSCIMRSGQTVGMYMYPYNTSSKAIEIIAGCEYSDWNNAKIDFSFGGVVGATIKPQGIVPKIVTSLPTASGLYTGVMYLLYNSSSNSYAPYICLKENGVDKWKKIALE